MICANEFPNYDSVDENLPLTLQSNHKKTNHDSCPSTSLVLMESRNDEIALTNQWNNTEAREPFSERTNVLEITQHIPKENCKAIVCKNKKNKNKPNKTDLVVRVDDRRIILKEQSVNQTLAVYHGGAIQESTSSREIVSYNSGLNSILGSIKQDISKFQDLLARIKTMNEDKDNVEITKKMQVMLGSVEELALRIKCNLNITGIKINQMGPEENDEAFDSFQELKRDFRRHHTIFHKFELDNKKHLSGFAIQLYGGDDDCGGTEEALTMYDPCESQAVIAISGTENEKSKSVHENNTVNDENVNQKKSPYKDPHWTAFEEDLYQLGQTLSKALQSTKEMIFNGCGMDKEYSQNV